MTQMLRAEGAVWPNAPKLYRDGIATPGTQYIIDCADPLCNSLSIGAIPNNTDIPSATVGTGYGFKVANADGDTTVYNNGSAGFRIDDVDSGDGIFDANHSAHYVDGKDFMAVVWFRQRTAFYSTANLQALFTNANDWNQGSFDFTLNSLAPRAAIRGVGWYNFPAEYATPLDTIMQLGVAHQAGKFMVFRQGTLIYSADALGPSLATSGIKDGISKISAQSVAALLNPFKGDVFRWWKENLTVSGSSAVAQVKKDWEMNKARFV